MLALIIVYYKQPQELREFWHSLKKNSDHDFKLFIADLTGSLKLHDSLPFACEIVKGQNKGYAYGVNLALRQALAQNYTEFAVLNYDTFVSGSFIKNVKFRFHTTAAFGGKIYYAPGCEYHQTRYHKNELGKVLWYAGGEIDWNHATVKHLGVDEVDKGQYESLTKTNFVAGTLFCFNKEVVNRVGWWDEGFFLYYEDTDYSVRIKKQGFELIYDPRILMWHKNGGTTGGAGSLFQEKIQARSRLRFGLKHAPWRTKVHLILNYLSRKVK